MGKLKLIEAAKFTQLWNPLSRTSTGTLYNSDGSTGSGLDTKESDEVVFQINVGAFAGASTTLNAAVYEAATNNADSASAVSGATFTEMKQSNQNTQRLVSVLCKNTKRYLWVRTVKAVDTQAVVYGINAIQYSFDSRPASNTVDADV